ncbi:MAG: hypothetical protein K2I20_02545 [Clostridia bacterium]|nr:hypothetical protein [Clostridia bacterium]MDE6356413.1 hypothetical protein [Clostridia bacterium]
MDKVKGFFVKVLDCLKSRWIGFYLLLPVVLLSFITAFVYLGTYKDMELGRYYSAIAFVLPLLGCAAFATAFFKYTERYAAIIMFAFMLAGLGMFANAVYYHVADVAFKGGIQGLENGFWFTAVVYIINIVLCFVAAFFKVSKPVNEPEETAEPDVTKAGEVQS